MERLTNWHEGLARWVGEARARPFAWGDWDCCLAIAAAVEAMTGQDFGAPFRGRYRDAKGAARIIVRHGGLVQLVTERIGPAIRVNFARLGDVGMLGAAGPLVISNGDKWLGVTATGLAAVDRDRASLAWSV